MENVKGAGRDDGADGDSEETIWEGYYELWEEMGKNN